MSLHHTDFSPLDRGTRRRKRPGLIADLALCACLLIGWIAGQAWHCLRYLGQRRP